jgi:hypothetical protein
LWLLYNTFTGIVKPQKMINKKKNEKERKKKKGRVEKIDKRKR